MAKRLIDNLEMSQNVLSEARNNINKVFADLNEDQDYLAAKNGVIDVDGSDILVINSGGSIISGTRDSLTQIKGVSLEAQFRRRWGKRFLRDRCNSMLLDVNPQFLQAMLDQPIEIKITPPDCYLKIPHAGQENSICLQ